MFIASEKVTDAKLKIYKLFPLELLEVQIGLPSNILRDDT